MKYLIKTFGCQMNLADSERIAAAYAARGFAAANKLEDADHVIINTCLVRQAAEDRIYGLVRNLSGWKEQNSQRKIVLTGCLVGLAVRDKTGKVLQNLRERLPQVDEFLPIEEVGFDQAPLRMSTTHAWVPISNGCNNFCSFCVVPYTRGPEVSRPLEEIIEECRQLRATGYKEVTLLGQNVNSYGADLVKVQNSKFKVQSGREIEPVHVRHMGKQRVPTLFPYLLEEAAKIGFDKVDFISSNPWDFSDELIDVIARHPNIGREIHLPVQSGDDAVLKRMNRGYTRSEFLKLVADLRSKIDDLRLTTDIIVGFPGETEEQFERTVDLCHQVGFAKAYLAMYSPRPRTAAQKTMVDDVPYLEKKRRWQVLEDLVNKPRFL